MKINTFNIFLASIVGFAIWYRCFGLLTVPPSLFSDEVDIGYQVKSLFATGRDYYGNYMPIQFHSFSDIRTALPIYATALVAKIPYVSIDLSIRLTPAIFSIISIIGIYYFINSLVKSFFKKTVKNHGLVASLVLTIMPWHFTYSRTGFELSMLFAFVIWGYYFLLKYLEKHKLINLIFSAIFLSLTPAIYSTAKLSLVIFPLTFLFLPGYWKTLLKNKSLKIYLVVLFVPLLVIILNGGASKRFSEIAVFTDPTLSSETNFSRQEDLGKNLIVGSSPNLLSKLAHNKPLLISEKIVENFINPLSTSFLFLSGDQNMRHAVPGWGMLQKTLLISLVAGLIFLFVNKRYRLLLFLLALVVLSISPSALTRDGATHSSRLFLLILPLVITISIGICEMISRYKFLLVSFFGLLFFESFLYFHTYWYHYPIVSERQFHAGLKEMVETAKSNPEKTVVISRTYEPLTIFFLYYYDFPPEKTQSLLKKGDLYEQVGGELNLEGGKIIGTNIYISSVRDYFAAIPLAINNAIYILPYKEAQTIVCDNKTNKLCKGNIVKNNILMPSGNNFMTVIETP